MLFRVAAMEVKFVTMSKPSRLNNIGPGLNQVGPMMNFGAYSNFAKLVLIFDMLAGRLEIFPMLVLFLPDAWRRF